MQGKDATESPRIVRISGVVQENPSVKTLTFDDPAKALPGQFVMVWIPGIDEVPMSVSYIGDIKGITVKNIGEATSALHNLSTGDMIGIRGPYGTYFKAGREKVLVVAGGIGIAPLAPFIEKAHEEGREVVLAFGAKTSEELLFLTRFENRCKEMHIATDDGSKGLHGFVSDLVEEILTTGDFDEILTCGPEKMIKKIANMARQKNIPVQASLERYVKCGVGICDSCAINGLHVCKDGPVFSGEVLTELADFGRQRRNASGTIEKL